MCLKKDLKPGIIQNPSAEITDGSVVKGWTSDPRARYAVQFYDNIAHQEQRVFLLRLTGSRPLVDEGPSETMVEIQVYRLDQN